MGVGNKVRRFFKKAAKWIAAAGLILVLVSIPAFFLCATPVIPLVLCLSGVGAVLLAFMIDKDQAKEGLKMVTDAIGDMAQEAGNVVGSVIGGLAQGVAGGFSKTPAGILLLIVGGIFLLNYFEGESNVQADRNIGERDKSISDQPIEKSSDLSWKEGDWNDREWISERGNVLPLESLV